MTSLTVLIFLVSKGCSSNKVVVTEDAFSVASSIEILQTTVDQVANGDYDLLGKHMETGDYYVLAKGTEIEILEIRDDKYVKCLVLDKRHRGKTFWTFVVSFEYGSSIPFDLIITK